MKKIKFYLIENIGKKMICLVVVFSVITGMVYSQNNDIIRIMHYNLLHYGINCNYCDTASNNIYERDKYLKEIIKYAHPDILTFNEIKDNLTGNFQHVLDSCLNVSGVSFYKMANPTNVSNAQYANQLFYNSNKFYLLPQHSVASGQDDIPDINIYKLFYKSGSLSTKKDTAFLNCIVIHPKSGQNASDAIARDSLIKRLLAYLKTNNIRSNKILLGDFNVYDSQDSAYTHLTVNPDNDFNFYDPLNRPGPWHETSSFSDTHTQSTHTGAAFQYNFVNGGLDDRFDFILISDSIMRKDTQSHYKYIDNSYKALAQDGKHFNLSLISLPLNTSGVPDTIINDLYCMSDHLPVILDLEINQRYLGYSIKDEVLYPFNIKFQNPVDERMDVWISSSLKSKLTIEIINVLGQTLFSKEFRMSDENAHCNISINDLRNGIYFLKVKDSENNSVVKKFIKQ